MKCGYFFGIVCLLYMILPDYLAIEFSNRLPLLTASRILLIGVYFSAFFFTFKNKGIRNVNRKWIVILCLYSVLRGLPNIYYLNSLSEAWNAIFKILTEQILLTLAFINIDIDHLDDYMIETMTYGVGMVSFFAIGETLVGLRIGDYLYTVAREMSHQDRFRLGLRRAVVTFGLPGFLAMYLIVMLPVVLYMYLKKKKKRYLAIAVLDFFALLYTGCRSGIGAFFISILLFWGFVTKEQKKEVLKACSICGMAIMIVVTLQSLTNEYYRYFYMGTVKSLLNEVGFEFDLSENAPEGVEGYGENLEGTYSRTAQFSGFQYTMSQHPIVGLGAGAQNRGAIHYFWKGKWKSSHTYDVGYVAFMGDEGFLGFFGQIGLLTCVLIFSFSKIKRQQEREKNVMFSVAFITYDICILFTDAMPKIWWMIFCAFLLCNKEFVIMGKNKEG